jgi:hypothetical protein
MTDCHKLIAFLLRIQEVSGSNLYSQTGYPDPGYRGIPQGPQAGAGFFHMLSEPLLAIIKRIDAIV